MKKIKLNKVVLKGIGLFLIVILGLLYFNYSLIINNNDRINDAMQIARSIEAMLPVEDLKALQAEPSDIDKPQYNVIKGKLKEIIRINSVCRFAYLYKERNGKLYFMADSEPVDSKDYSPPGQEYTEADPVFYPPFKDGKELVTNPVTDRWGTWRSVLIPIKDEATGKTLAVFAMDYSIRVWSKLLFHEILEAASITFLLILAFIFLLKIKVRNQKLKLEINERTQTEIALSHSHELMRYIIEHNRSSIAVHDRDLKYIYVSQLYLRDYNLTEQDIIGKHHYEVFPDLPQKWRDVHQKALAGEISSAEDDPFEREDGTVEWTRWECRPWYEKNGSVGGFIIYTEVITERKRVEIALQESEQRYKSLFQNNHTVMLLINPENQNIIDANPAACKYYGWTYEEIITKKITDINILSSEEAHAEMQKALHENNNYFSFRHCLASGEIRDVEVASGPIYMNGKNLLYSLVHDISERKKTESALRESEQRFNSILKSSPDLIAVTDLEGRFLMVSDVAPAMFGYDTSDQMLGRSLLDFIIPEDRERAKANILHRLQGAMSGAGIYHGLRADGSIFDIEVNGDYFRDADGHPSKIVYIIRDITQRNLIEKALLESQERNNTLLMIHPDMMFMCDENGVFIGCHVEINAPLYAPQSSFMGKNISEVMPAEIAEKTHHYLRKLFRSGQMQRFEYQLDINKEPNYFEARLVRSGNNKALVVVTDITKRVLADQILRQQADAMGAATDGLAICNEDSKLIYANKSMVHMYGYEHIDELIGESWRMLYDSDELQRFDREIMPKVSKDSHYQGRVFGKKKDGSKFPQSISLTSLKNGGLICVTHDITEQKQAEEAMVKLEKAIYTSGEAIFLTDKEGLFTFVNPAFSSLYGFSSDEVVGKATPRIIKSGKLDKSVYKSFWQTLLKGEEVRGELLNKTKEGTLFTVDSSATPVFDEEKNIIGFLGIQHDITRQKLTEQELINAKEKAEESDRLKSAFLSNMSHEIRTPMNGILGFAGLLKDPNLSGEEQEDYIGVIEKSCERMLNIINDIVEISKIESGMAEINIKETNVNAQIDYIHSFFKLEVKRKGLKFIHKNGLPDKDAIVRTDREKLYAILINLVKNAIKYSDKGRIELGYKKNDALFEFYVKDTGIGIPKDKQEAVFDRFVQADMGNRRSYEGAGLGLAISKSYVEMLGGKIWVESEEGKGSVFYFTIPVHTESAKAVIDNLTGSDAAEPKIRKLNILIAEDDEISRKFITTTVEIFSKKILRAITGIEAVKTCRNNPDIDLILMDIQMPEMDGYEATRQIRLFNKDVVIIAQTAFALSHDREEAILAGCTDYISKPIDQKKLKGLMIKHFEKQKEESIVVD